MKKLYAIIFVTFFIAVFASVGIASAQTTTISGSAQVFFDKTPSPGAFVTLRVNFQSAHTSALQLYRIGIHADWQAENNYYTLTLTDLEQVEANGFYSKSVSITIPQDAQVGAHTLTVAIDGYTADGSTFSWDSSPQNFDVSAFAPTVSATANQNGTNNASPLSLNDIIIYAAVIAVVVVVVILLLVILMKRKSRTSKAPAAEPTSYAPEPSSTPPPQQAPQEQQAEDKGSEEKPEGKDFNI